MARNKPAAKKIRLASAARRNKMPPVWAVLRKFGKGRGRHVHPYRIGPRKRHWRSGWVKA